MNDLLQQKANSLQAEINRLDKGIDQMDMLYGRNEEDVRLMKGKESIF